MARTLALAALALLALAAAPLAAADVVVGTWVCDPVEQTCACQTLLRVNEPYVHVHQGCMPV
ncbi:MAG TPA: hypothetical protein VNX21_04475 [Candidatus Thermoplasmatota archaeon]|nr:hypothetical protein [Candidatus Thermoplasmatota archaeon]